MRKLLGAAFLILTLVLLALLGFKTLLPDRTFLKELVIRLDDYSAQHGDSYRQKLLESTGPAHLLQIHFQFRVDQVDPYDNVFQTALGDDGLRMELNTAGDQNYVAALIVGRDAAGQARGIPLPGQFRLGELYDFEASFRNGVLRVAINGAEQLHMLFGGPPPRISEIRAGIGFDELRKLSGDVSDFSLRIPLRAQGAPKTFEVVHQAMFVLCVACAVLMLAFFRFLKQQEPERVEAEKSAIPKEERGFARKNDLLLVIRAFACFVVVLTHVFGTTAPEHWTSLVAVGTHNITWLFYSVAWIGMWIFFTLSGYLMGKAFFSNRYSPTYRGILSFYYNRFLRIVPLYCVALFVVVFFARVEVVRWENLDVFIKLLTFTYDGHQKINPIGALWSISTEMHYYLVVPFVALLFLDKHVSNRKWFLVHLTTVVLLGLAYRRSFGSAHEHDHLAWLNIVYVPFISNADLFLGGFFLSAALSGGFGKLLDRIKPFYRAIPGLLTVAMLGLYLCGSRVMYVGFMEGQWSEAIFVDEILPTVTALVTLSMIALIEMRKHFEKVHRIEKRKTGARNAVLALLEHFGIITYGMYVWHTPIIEQLVRVIPQGNPWTTYLWRLSSTLVISIALSHFTYVFLERVMEKKKLFA